MTTLPIRARGLQRHIRGRLQGALLRAEFLKLRRRRGLVASVLLLTVGAVVTAYASLVTAHAVAPHEYGPAGGMHQFQNALYLMSQLGTSAAILVGATAGAGDIGSGFFRQLVATGRSRRALFTARIPGGLALLLPTVASAYAIAAVCAVTFADSRPAPHALLLIQTGGWLLMDVTVLFLVALGLGSLLGERSTTLGILIPIQLFVTPLIAGIGAVGQARNLLIGIDVWRLAPSAVRAASGPQTGLELPAVLAVSILTVWCCLALLAGAWRTLTRDA